MTMQVLVVGCGAIGGLFAAALTRAAKVAVYDTNAEHVRAINANGLRVIDKDSATIAQIKAVDDPSRLKGEAFDAVIFLVKSKFTPAALAAVQPALRGREILVTLQNGMGNAEALLQAPQPVIVRGVTMNAARYIGPGRIESLIRGKTWLGPRRGSLAEIASLAALMNAAGLPTEPTEDPMGAVWAKFVFNCVMNPVGALLLGDNAARYESNEVRALIDDMAAECTAVVRALGGHFAFDPMDFVTKIRAGELPIGKHAGSMALDIGRGAATEIDELTGFIVREGERLGVAVPNCKAVYRLVKGLELAATRRYKA
ncbi:MAG TPA: 2-dehydropantoate 2-reductase [Pseudolabrys sp.]|nr:2-dehydropantoate 2-reductase [Pseudolabrys sp.]